MSTTRFLSTDAGAPVIDGTTGNGIPNILDVCLVGSGTAYGALPKKGWSKPYTGTNKGVYLTVDGVGYLRVMHDGSNTGGFREALVRAAEGASDVDTLVDQYPSTADVVAGNETWRTSDTLDSTARAWELIADDNWFILSVKFGTTSGDTYFFGKFSSARSANSWNYIVSSRDASNNNGDGRSAQNALSAPAGFGSPRLWAMRTVDGVAKSPRAAFVTESCISASALNRPGAAGPPIPNADGLIFMSPPQIWINGVAGATLSSPQSAGFFPNLWSPMHSFALAGLSVFYGDVFNAAGYDPSAQFAIRGPGADTAGKWIIETTDTWQDPLA